MSVLLYGFETTNRSKRYRTVSIARRGGDVLVSELVAPGNTLTWIKLAMSSPFVFRFKKDCKAPRSVRLFWSLKEIPRVGLSEVL